MARHPPRLGRSAISGDGRTGSDVKKICDGFYTGVEHESAGAGANVITLADRGLQSVWRKQTRHAKQRLAEAILEDTLVIREDQRFAVALVDMEIEQEASAVVGRKTFESIGNGLRIAVGRMAVRHVQDGGRKGGRVRIAPSLQDPDRRIESGAHRRLALAARLE